MEFVKAHGTGNDFVVLPDPDGALALTPDLVIALCDRRRGIGADGVLRVIRTAKHPDAATMVGEAEWFMDYHNCDGSIAEMCGNGVRAYARYLVANGLAKTGAMPLATRAGVVRVTVDGDLISVDLARPVVGGPASVVVGDTRYAGTSVVIGNPHLVCPVTDLASLDLSHPPILDAAVFPAGANVEFVVPVADSHVAMRVYERGSGETLSCGSGAGAVAAVALRDAGRDDGVVTVDVPGGRLTIGLDGDVCRLTGPAVIVAYGETTIGKV
jgi:diaminopimelate epimerase